MNAWLAGVRAGYGAVQLLRPAYSVEQLLGGPLDPGAVAAVRGTELGVSQAGDDSPAQVGVFDEGHVSVTKPGQTGEVKLARKRWPLAVCGRRRRIRLPRMAGRLPG